MVCLHVFRPFPVNSTVLAFDRTRTQGAARYSYSYSNPRGSDDRSASQNGILM
jgi:hypothetical protein